MKTDTTDHTITTDLLRAWRACADGRDWFAARFPAGAPLAKVLAALEDDGRLHWYDWLIENALFEWRVLPEVCALPDGLRWLDLHKGASLPNLRALPDGLRRLDLHKGASMPSITALPERLELLCLYEGASLPDGVAIPAGCGVYRF